MVLCSPDWIRFCWFFHELVTAFHYHPCHLQVLHLRLRLEIRLIKNYEQMLFEHGHKSWGCSILWLRCILATYFQIYEWLWKDHFEWNHKNWHGNFLASQQRNSNHNQSKRPFVWLARIWVAVALRSFLQNHCYTVQNWFPGN